MKLLVLAGGFGTRLKSAVPTLPKALAPVDGKPFIYYQVQYWKSKGIRRFVFLLHYQYEKILEYILSERNALFLNCQCEWVLEGTPLGTGGAILNAITVLNIKSDFLITNADTLVTGNFDDIFKSKSPTLVVSRAENIDRFGFVEFNHDKFVVSFSEKKTGAAGSWVNTGIALLNPMLFDGNLKLEFSLERDQFPIWVNQKILKVTECDGSFIDIGVPEDYYRFCSEYTKGG